MAGYLERVAGGSLSRRGFVRASAVAAATLAAAGGLSACANTVQEAGTEQGVTEEKWVPVACWHGCSTRMCVNKALVKDGVVIRQKSDDTHEDTVERPQHRGCLRGRSQRKQVFGADRLKYPMKRKHWEPLTGGDKSLRGKDEWERITWDEALDYVAAELKNVIERYGNAAILGDGEVAGFLNRIGGFTSMWGTHSFGAYSIPVLYNGYRHLGREGGNDRMDLQEFRNGRDVRLQSRMVGLRHPFLLLQPAQARGRQIHRHRPAVQRFLCVFRRRVGAGAPRPGRRPYPRRCPHAPHGGRSRCEPAGGLGLPRPLHDRLRRRPHARGSRSERELQRLRAGHLRRRTQNARMGVEEMRHASRADTVARLRAQAFQEGRHPDQLGSFPRQQRRLRTPVLHDPGSHDGAYGQAWPHVRVEQRRRRGRRRPPAVRGGLEREPLRGRARRRLHLQRRTVECGADGLLHVQRAHDQLRVQEHTGSGRDAHVRHPSHLQLQARHAEFPRGHHEGRRGVPQGGFRGDPCLRPQRHGDVLRHRLAHLHAMGRRRAHRGGRVARRRGLPAAGMRAAFRKQKRPGDRARPHEALRHPGRSCSAGARSSSCSIRYVAPRSLAKMARPQKRSLPSRRRTSTPGASRARPRKASIRLRSFGTTASALSPARRATTTAMSPTKTS